MWMIISQHQATSALVVWLMHSLFNDDTLADLWRLRRSLATTWVQKEFHLNFPLDTLLNVTEVDTFWLGASRRLTFELWRSCSSAYISSSSSSLSHPSILAHTSELQKPAQRGGNVWSSFPFPYAKKVPILPFHWISTKGEGHKVA